MASQAGLNPSAQTSLSRPSGGSKQRPLRRTEALKASYRGNETWKLGRSSIPRSLRLKVFWNVGNSIRTKSADSGLLALQVSDLHTNELKHWSSIAHLSGPGQPGAQGKPSNTSSVILCFLACVAG